MRTSRLVVAVFVVAVACIVIAVKGLPGHGTHKGTSAAVIHHTRAPLTHPHISVPDSQRDPKPSPSQHGCAKQPSDCDYPGPPTTGVPSNVKLRDVPSQISAGPGWHYDPRGWVEVDGDGAVLKGLFIPVTLDIKASNVVVEDVKVETTGNGFGISLRHTRNVTIAYSDVYSPYRSGKNRLEAGIKDVFGDAINTVVVYDNVWHTSTAVQMSAGLIAENYIHDLGYAPGDHLDGIASDGGRDQELIVRHNTVLDPWDQTTAVGIFEDFGAQRNCLIENNLIAGGSYPLYAGANSGGKRTSDIKVIGNRFSEIYFPNGGVFGPVASFDPNGPGNEWRGNFWDDTGSVVPE